MNFINGFLNKRTMYWLMHNLLRLLIAYTTVLSVFHVLPYVWWHILAIAVYLSVACWAANWAFGKIFGVTPNPESQYITAEILTLIVGPFNPLTNWWFLLLISVVAMGSKYILAYRKRHFFNPAALGSVVAALTIGQSASWWVGSIYTFPIILVGGLLLLYKMRWLHLIWSFLISYFILFFAFNLGNGLAVGDAAIALKNTVLGTSLLFFSLIMLTEPLTAPSRRNFRIIYGALTAVLLFVIQQYVPAAYYNLELTLVIMNIAAFAMTPNLKVKLKLREKDYFARGGMELVFAPERPIKFRPGQYMQFMLPHDKPDSRGTRRYFSIASAPSEGTIMLATKLPDQPSSFKNHLKDLQKDEIILSSSLDGDFLLPKDEKIPLVLVAGGVGIAPFRSMVKELIHQNSRRDITLLYAVNEIDEMGFTEVFDEAEEKIGLKTIYVVQNNAPASWTGKIGRLSPALVRGSIPDYENKTYFISGPDPMVRYAEKMFKDMGIRRRQIKTDYFPGYE
jgi:ferredoxin-NADP reductase/Na+-translocating ferredoxin:NAD+ oxidoreductase RnfD subunit